MLDTASVYLVDADKASRGLMSRWLAERGIEAWPFGGAAELSDLAGQLRPSIVLLSFDSLVGDPLALLDRLTGRSTDWPVIAYGGHADVATAVATMRRGALDFLEMPLDPHLFDAAFIAARDRLDRSFVDRRLTEAARERAARLTARERDVASALLRGESNKNVAYALGISVRTVEMHRANLIAKLEVRNIAEAAVLLARAGFAGATKEPGSSPRPAGVVLPLSFRRTTASAVDAPRWATARSVRRTP